MFETMLILGIDPGVARTGWGIIESEKGKVKAINFDCFETASTTEITQRLLLINEHVNALLKKYNPDVLAIEDLFFSNNAKTAFAVGQARGVVLLAAAKYKVPIAVYTPPQVKVVVTGYGKADKRQVGQMIKAILGLKIVPKLDDTADALAIALAHAFSAKLKAQI